MVPVGVGMPMIVFVMVVVMVATKDFIENENEDISEWIEFTQR